MWGHTCSNYNFIQSEKNCYLLINLNLQNRLFGFEKRFKAGLKASKRAFLMPKTKFLNLA